MGHHLLRDGCTCSCPGDASNSCNECNECRRFWKAPMQGELAQSVTAGYAGPVLPGEGNLVPYEYTMHYVLPAGVTTTRGVLRWHYMTTNSCTSGSSAPEEFWNCADVTVADADGNMGAEIHFDNTALRNLEVNNLMPQIESGALGGVSHACPVDSQGNLKGVGSADEYHCGAENTDGTYEFCKGASGSASTDVQCVGTSASSVQCLEECGDWWYQCANGAAFVKPVPVGTKCKSDSFVIEAVCTSGGASPTTSPPPSSTLAPTAAPSPQSAPTPAPIPSARTTTSAPTPAHRRRLQNLSTVDHAKRAWRTTTCATQGQRRAGAISTFSTLGADNDEMPRTDPCGGKMVCLIMIFYWLSTPSGRRACACTDFGFVRVGHSNARTLCFNVSEASCFSTPLLRESHSSFH